MFKSILKSFNPENASNKESNTVYSPPARDPEIEKTDATSRYLNVSSKTAPGHLAGAIAGVIRQFGSVELAAIGAGAVNQAVKGIAIARGFVIPSGYDLVTKPVFDDLKLGSSGEQRTGVKLIVTKEIKGGEE